jgi:hypothetical protein
MVLVGAGLVAPAAGALWIRTAGDAAAALSAALLSGLAVLMLGGWLSARRVQV